ncbi:hypothetical protein ABBQ32_001231 [Trebouxia sp. C0010 RCD-2024]
MLDRQIVVASPSKAVSALAGERAVAAAAEQLHQQRLIERDQHHHKQLWTKESHGGPYRKAESPGHPQHKPKLGYERPKSGPTTNFVGTASHA